MVPQTGLSVLMNGGVTYINHSQAVQQTNLAPSTSAPSISSLLPPDARQKYQQDLIERDRQASALAAAGKVAETINLTKSSGGQVMQQVYQGAQLQQGHEPQGTSPSVVDGNNGITSELDNINWSLMDLGGPALDDMDLDFATLFDPANELSHIQPNGNGFNSTLPEIPSLQSTQIVGTATTSVTHQSSTGESKSQI
jgi:hypothetical protein